MENNQSCSSIPKHRRMKEDSDLLCPIGFDDPMQLWQFIEKDIQDKLPLRDITCKHHITSSLITIPQLPLRFMPSTSNLFKDSDHPYRWFLAPYVNIYIVSIESMNAYKQTKNQIKIWIDMHKIQTTTRASWMLVYVPLRKQPVEVYNKIYAKLSSEFCIEKTGDRTVMLFLSITTSDSKAQQLYLQQQTNSINELLLKVRDGVVASFLQRTALYDAEIRRLDTQRGTSQMDFKQIFLVKESLALMYQMMQLPADALLQYEELEALVTFVPSGILPESDWPMINETIRISSPKKSHDKDIDKLSHTKNVKELPSNNKDKDPWIYACRQGDEILSYSINLARMRIVQNKISLIELNKYIFSRQIHFLIELDKPLLCAEKGLSFITTTRDIIKKKIEFIRKDLDIIPKEYDRGDNNNNNNNNSNNNNNEVFSNIQRRDIENTTTSQCLLTIDQLRSKQADLWVISSTVRLVRVIHDLSSADIQFFSNDKSNSSNDQQSNRKSLPNRLLIMKATSRVISDLLQYSTSKLHYILLPPFISPINFNKESNNNDIIGKSEQTKTLILSSRPPSSLRNIFKLSIQMASTLCEWDDVEIIKSEYIMAFPTTITSLNSLSSHILTSRTTPTSTNVNQDEIEILSPLPSTSPHSRTTQVSTIQQLLDSNEVWNINPSDNALYNSSFLNNFSQRLRFMMYQWWEQISDNHNSSISSSFSSNINSESSFSSSSKSISSLNVSVDVDVRDINLKILPQTINTKFRERARNLQASIIVILFRLLIDNEIQSQRYRFAERTKINCGDVLMCNGYFKHALNIFNETLSSSSGLILSNELNFDINQQSSPLSTPIKSNIVNKNRNNNIYTSPNNSSLYSSSTTLSSKHEPSKFIQKSSILSIKGGEWTTIKYWTLRKMLVCSRNIDDSISFCKLALLLLDPYLVEYHLSLHEIKNINNDNYKNRNHLFIDNLAKDVIRLASYHFQNNEVDGNNKFLTDIISPQHSCKVSRFFSETSNIKNIQKEIILPLKPFFEASVIYDTNCDGFINQNNSKKNVHDEYFPVSTIHYTAGKKQVIRAKLKSRFPIDLTLAPDSVSIMYRKYSNSSIISSLDVNINRNNEEIIDEDDIDNNISSTSSNNFFLCKSISNSELSSSCCSSNDNSLFELPLTLKPGEQIIELEMNPNSLGEFCIYEISIKIHGLIFRDTIQCSTFTHLHDFLKNHSIISVDIPNVVDLLNFQVISPTFSPLFQDNSLFLSLNTQDNDIINDLSITCDNYKISNNNNTNNSSNLDILISQPTNWSIDITRHSSLNEKDPIITLKDIIIDYIEKNNEQKSFTSDDDLNIIQKVIQEPLCVLSSISGLSSSIEISIPYKFQLSPSESNDIDIDELNISESSLNNKITTYCQFQLVNLNIKGKLIRNGCNIDIDISNSCNFNAGISLSSSIETVYIKNNTFVNQMLIKNVSPVPLELVSYSFNDTNKELNRLELLLLEGPNEFCNETDSTLLHSNYNINEMMSSIQQRKIVIESGEEYYAAFIYDYSSKNNSITYYHHPTLTFTYKHPNKAIFNSTTQTDNINSLTNEKTSSKNNFQLFKYTSFVLFPSIKQQISSLININIINNFETNDKKLVAMEGKDIIFSYQLTIDKNNFIILTDKNEYMDQKLNNRDDEYLSSSIYLKSISHVDSNYWISSSKTAHIYTISKDLSVPINMINIDNEDKISNDNFEFCLTPILSGDNVFFSPLQINYCVLLNSHSYNDSFIYYPTMRLLIDNEEKNECNFKSNDLNHICILQNKVDL
jgi:hypothetical protein